MEELKAIVEIEDVDIANKLAICGDYCQPHFSEKRNLYIFIRKKKK